MIEPVAMTLHFSFDCAVVDRSGEEIIRGGDRRAKLRAQSVNVLRRSAIRSLVFWSLICCARSRS